MAWRIPGMAVAAIAAAAPIAVVAAPRPSVTVSVSELAAPCVRAAARAWTGALSLCIGRPCAARADAVVLSAVEMNRALESGQAVDGTDIDVARVPWVLAIRQPAAEITGLDDLAREEREVRLLAGPASYEARRALSALPGARVRESADERELRAAPFALVPLSLARGARQVAVDVPPVVVRAAVAASSRRPDAAAAFVRFLGSEAGQRAFAECGP